MRTLRSVFFCICLESLLAYPLRESPSNEDSIESINHFEDVAKGVGVLFPEVTIKPSRLDRLIDTYINVLKKGSSPLDFNVAGSIESNVNTESLLPGNAHFKNNFELPGEQTASSDLKQLNFVESDRLKRQPGWHIQYGKRNGDKLASADDPLPAKNFHPVMDSVSLQSSSSFPAVTTFLGDDGDTSLAAFLNNIALLSESATGIDAMNGKTNPMTTDNKSNADEKANNWDEGIKSNKRNNQGWYISYGKRNNSNKQDVYLLRQK